MFGANPAEVKGGDRKGLRTLPAIEDEARKLIKSLSAEQVSVAKQPAPEGYEKKWEIKENNPRADIGEPVGITADKLTDEQRKTLINLLKAYADRMPEDLKETESKKLADIRWAQVYFAYTGSPVPGEPYTYRVHAPEFAVEFLNVQADGAKNPANHIHSAWRRLPADFGLAK